jgi:hypothetical protein
MACPSSARPPLSVTGLQTALPDLISQLPSPSVPSATPTTNSSTPAVDYDTPELIATITNPQVFSSAMSVLGFDESQISLGKVPDLSKCHSLVKELERMLSQQNLNSTQQNRVINLSRQLSRVLPQSPARQCKVCIYLQQIELLRDVKALQNVIRSMGGLCAVRKLLESRIELLGLRPSQRITEAISKFFTLKDVWAVKPLPTEPPTPPPLNEKYFLYTPSLLSVAINLLEGIRPVTVLEGAETPVIHLHTSWEKFLPTVKPVTLADGSSVGVIFLVVRAIEVGASQSDQSVASVSETLDEVRSSSARSLISSDLCHRPEANSTRSCVARLWSKERNSSLNLYSNSGPYSTAICPSPCPSFHPSVR